MTPPAESWTPAAREDESRALLPRQSVVIPVYHSEDTLRGVVDRTVEVVGPGVESLEIVLVNDGSTDGSDRVARECVAAYPDVVRYVRLGRNFGEHNAVMCGLSRATGACTAIIDDDFQNPPEEILRLAAKVHEGWDVVYSRYENKQHHWFRNLGSRLNDWFATRVLRKPKGLYLSSFKALSAPLVQSVVEYRGPYPYVDALVLRSTDSIATVLCRHSAREAGRSNYTLRKLVALWLNMFTGYSVAPLRLATMLGGAFAVLALLMTAFFVVARIAGKGFLHVDLPPGWASLIVSVTFFAGVQLCVLGLIGEYLGRLFVTVNGAPQYVVREEVGGAAPPPERSES